MMRTLLVGLIIVLLLLSCGLAIKYNQEAMKNRKALDQERYVRITTEEDLKAAQTKNEALQKELDRSKKKLAGLEKSLEQTEALNQDLKQRIDQAENMRKRLEVKINELLELSGSKEEQPAEGS